MSKYDRDSADVYEVKRLGDEIGYGHLMALAHELWARHLESKGLPRTGAFVAVSFPMVKEEYQADAIRDQIYTIVVGKALDTTDTPQTESTGSPIGDYRDGAGAPQTERMTEEEIDTMLAKALVGQTDCGWGEPDE